MLMLSADELKALALKHTPAFKNYFKKNKNRLKKMDNEVHFLHEKTMSATDCLQCANCCKNLGPALYDKDIEKIAKALRIKPADVVEQYLRIDEDHDYVFKSMPCPFLMPDNYCSIYEHRPKACKEYPHTNRKKFYQIYHLTIKNASICPVTYEILKKVSDID